MASYNVKSLSITKNGNTYNLVPPSSVYYGECSTGAGTQAKAVTIDGITEYDTGLSVRIKFTNAQTYNGAPTLNINSLGAKTIRYVAGTNAARYHWNVGEVIDFVYDGTYFVMTESGLATTTYYGRTKLSSDINSTSEVLAATPKAVKTAYDLAHAAIPSSQKGVAEGVATLDENGLVTSTENPVMTGATASSAGAKGLVPAPAAGDQNKILTASGTWEARENGKLFTKTLDTVTNSGGYYTHTTTVSDVTSEMKATVLEVSNPEAFKDSVHITVGDGSISLTCDDVNGTSEVTVTAQFVNSSDMITSSEFDILENRISSKVAELQDALGIVCNGNKCSVAASIGQYVILKNSTISGCADGLYTAAQAIPANTAVTSAYLTAVSGGGLNALNSNIATVEAKIPQIKTGTYTGTANANGDVVTNIPASRKILGWVTDGAQLVIGGVFSGKRVFTTVAKTGSGQQTWHSNPNESISMTYYYLA